MAENISKGFCYKHASGVFCPECKKEELIYIGCEIHHSDLNAKLENDEIIHYYHCPNCDREWSNLILSE